VTVRIFLARHAETAWSKAGRHTGRSDIPLTEHGELAARAMGERLRGVAFGLVLSSPLSRARRTRELALPGIAAELAPDLAEWDYGAYEGLTSAEVRAQAPGWNLFRDGCPRGESPADISARADSLLARLRTLDGNVALFTHGHVGRVLAARWIGLPALEGRRLLLDAGTLSVLACEHGDAAEPVLALWNEAASVPRS
jgi:broad specificity phosphatase PhoE